MGSVPSGQTPLIHKDKLPLVIMKALYVNWLGASLGTGSKVQPGSALAVNGTQ